MFRSVQQTYSWGGVRAIRTAAKETTHYVDVLGIVNNGD